MFQAVWMMKTGVRNGNHWSKHCEDDSMGSNAPKCNDYTENWLKTATKRQTTLESPTAGVPILSLLEQNVGTAKIVANRSLFIASIELVFFLWFVTPFVTAKDFRLFSVFVVAYNLQLTLKFSKSVKNCALTRTFNHASILPIFNLGLCCTSTTCTIFTCFQGAIVSQSTQ